MRDTEERLWYTEPELAKLLRVHPSTVSRRVREGTLPLKPLVIGTRRMHSVAEVRHLAGVSS